MKITRTITTAAAVLLVSAGCSAEFQESLDKARSTETVTAAPSTTTSRYLPDDTSSDYTPAPSSTDAESVFRDATCDLLDEGYTVGDVMLGSVMADTPFTDEESGTLIAEAILSQCPEYTQDMFDTLEDLGY